MADINVTLGADASQYKKEISSANSTFSNFVVTTNQGIELISKAFNLLKGAIQGPLEAFRQAELATNKLRLSLENQGLEVNRLTEGYKDIAAALQQKTGVDDDAITSGLALLQSFIGQQEVTSELAGTLVDLAERTGSMEEAATVLGRAIAGDVRGLKQFKVEIDTTGSQAERTSELISKLNVRVGGLAEAAGQGLGGFRGLNSAVSDLQEALGAELAPSVSKVVGELTKLIAEFTKTNEFKLIAAALAESFTFVAKGVLEFIKGLRILIPAVVEAKDAILGFLGVQQKSQAATAGADTAKAAAKAFGAVVDEQEKARQKDIQNQAAADQKKKDRNQQVIDEDKAALKSLLANNEEFQSLSKDQQNVFLDQRREELLKLQQTELEAQIVFTDQLLQEEIKRNNALLLERQKYGAAVAAINNVITSKEVQGVKTASGQLVALQNSKSNELKTIGKAAAVAQITIATAESAMNIFKGFSIIPFIGVPLGIAGAAAAVAFGAEQIAQVVSAQEGGIVPGANKGFDSVPALLQPGELVVPRNNFSDVVSAMADRRAKEEGQSASFSGFTGAGGRNEIVTRLEFSGDNAEKFLTARQVEARSLGTLAEAS